MNIAKRMIEKLIKKGELVKEIIELKEAINQINAQLQQHSFAMTDIELKIVANRVLSIKSASDIEKKLKKKYDELFYIFELANRALTENK